MSAAFHISVGPGPSDTLQKKHYYFRIIAVKATGQRIGRIP